MWQPMTVGTILDRTFKTYREKFVEISLFSLLIGGIVNLLISVFQPGGSVQSILAGYRNMFSVFGYENTGLLDALGSSGAQASTQNLLISSALNLLDRILIPPVLAGGIILITLAVFHRKDVKRNALFPEVFSRYGKLLRTQLSSIVVTFAIVIAIVIVFGIIIGISVAIFSVSNANASIIIVAILVGLAIVFAVLLCISFTMFIIPVAVQEGLYGFKAVGRALGLFRRKLWKSTWLFLLCSLITYPITLVLSLLVAFLPRIFAAVILSVIQGLVTPISIIAFTYLYLDVRMRTEGYDFELRNREALESAQNAGVTEADGYNDGLSI